MAACAPSVKTGAGHFSPTPVRARAPAESSLGSTALGEHFQNEPSSLPALAQASASLHFCFCGHLRTGHPSLRSPGSRSRNRTRGDVVPSLSVLPTWARVPAAITATALGGVGMGEPRFALLARSQLLTCLTELAQGLRQQCCLGRLFLRRPRCPPLAPRPVRSIPGGLQAPQGHGR